MMADEPAAEEAATPAPEPEPEKVAAYTEAYETRGKFLGIFDVNEPGGALAASVIVSVAFVVGVEFIKFLDPNTAGDSMFGSLKTIGL